MTDTNQPDYSDPAYWESVGIKMIVIDTEDEESVNAGLEEIGQRIQQAVSDMQQAEENADF